MSSTLNPTTIGTISAVGAAVIPPVVSFLKREKWSAQVKQLVAAVVSLVVACVGIAVTVNNWSVLSIAQLTALAYGGATVVYGVYFKGSAVDTKLTSLGSKNAVTPPAAQ